MIESIRIQNFKAHRNTVVPLSRFTVLVGPNGSGKTSVLDALWLQGQLTKSRFVEVLPGEFPDLLHRAANGNISFSSTFADGRQLDLSISPQAASLWSWKVRGPSQSAPLGDTLFAHPNFADRISPASLYKLVASRIAAAAYSDTPGTAVDQDGTNTAVALAEMKLGYDEAFARVEKDLSRVVRSVERVRIHPAKVRRMSAVAPGLTEEVVGHRVFFDFRGAPTIPASNASEGTLITLALLTVLHGPKRPRILLLDDFDQSLHPQAQVELVKLIQALLDENKDLQIVATTHSPYVLDALDPRNVIVFALRPDGSAALKRLSQHPEAEKMKGSLTAGQLWSLDAEQEWVLKDNPA